MARRYCRRSVSYSNSDHCPEFFKIYLPEINSHRLRIPPAFIKNFRRTPKTAIIKNLVGNFWHVELEKVEGTLFIRKGWEEYVSDHSLDPGDFLVFRYIRDTVFLVKVFGRNGCEKEEPSTSRKEISSMEVKQEAKVEDVSMQRTHTCKQDYLETGSCGQTHLSSNNRQFVKTFDQAHPYAVRIPVWFLSQQGIIKCPKKILLRSENGAVQLVASFLMKDGRLDLRHGWKDFCLKNKVMHGDLCKFEILLDRGGRIKEIFVQISHEND